MWRPRVRFRRRFRRLTTVALMGLSSRSRVAALADSNRYFEVQTQMSVSLHRLHQMGQRRLQPLPADAVRSFPDHDHRVSDRLVVDAPTLDPRHLVLRVPGLSQQPDAVFPVVTGDCDELVENKALVLSGRCPVTVSNRSQKFLLRHPADASRQVTASRFFGSILFEAITS